MNPTIYYCNYTAGTRFHETTMVLNQCDGVVSETIWHLNGEAIKISAVRCRFRQREPLTTVAMREVALFVTLVPQRDILGIAPALLIMRIKRWSGFLNKIVFSITSARNRGRTWNEQDISYWYAEGKISFLLLLNINFSVFTRMSPIPFVSKSTL